MKSLKSSLTNYLIKQLEQGQQANDLLATIQDGALEDDPVYSCIDMMQELIGENGGIRKEKFGDYIAFNDNFETVARGKNLRLLLLNLLLNPVDYTK